MTIVAAAGPTVVGDGVQLHATARNQDGSNSDVTALAMWTSESPQISSVSSAGFLRCVSVGNSDTTASYGGGASTIHVNCSIPQITLAAIPRVNLVGNTVQLHANASYVDGTTREITSIATWGSSAPGIATIDRSGRLNCASVGNTVVSVADEGAVASAELSCSLPLISIQNVPKLNLVGKTSQLEATARYVDGSELDITALAVWNSTPTSIGTVDANGVLACHTVGKVQFTATSSGVSATASAYCSNPELEIGGLPALNIVGQVVALAATISYADGSSASVTNLATWSSGSPAIAAVTPSGLLTCDHVGITQLSAAFAGVTATISLSCTVPLITFAPPPAVTLVGSSYQLQASAIYADGSQADVTSLSKWDSSQASVATVDKTGLMTCTGIGTTTLSATYETQSSTKSISCSVPMIVMSGLPKINLVGGSSQLHAAERFADQSSADVTTKAIWSSRASSIAGIDSAGLLSCHAVGDTQLSASYGGGTTSLPVTCSVPRITISPLPSINLVGDFTQLHVTAEYVDGTSIDASSKAAWTSSVPSVATVTTSGGVTCLTVGHTQLTAYFEDVSSITSLDCSKPSIAISPAPVVNLVGETIQFHAIASYADGTHNDVSSTAGWSSLAPGVATVDAQGLATCRQAGVSQVEATFRDISSVASLTCSTPTISVSIDTKLYIVQNSYQAQAKASFIDGSTIDITSSGVWSTSSPALATVSSNGLLTCDAAGSVTLTVSYKSASKTVPLNCSRPQIAVSGLQILNLVGKQSQLRATASFIDGSNLDVTATAVWTTDSSSVASDKGGLLYCRSVGSARLSVSYSGTLLSVNVACSSPTVSIIGAQRVNLVGTSTQLRATASYADGSNADVTTESTWSSSNPAVGAVGPNGLMTCRTTGNVEVSASLLGVSATASLICSIPVVTITDPSSLHIVGKASTLTANASFSDGSKADFTIGGAWTSSSPSVAIISNTGQLTCRAIGDAEISASFEGAIATVPIVCSVPSLKIDQIPALSLVGKKYNLRELAKYIDGSAVDVTGSAEWGANPSAVASIDPNGALSCLTVGVAQVTAVFEGATSTASVTCSAPKLSITGIPSLNLVGTSTPLQVTATYADGSSASVSSSVHWQSTNSLIATIGGPGSFTCQAVGSVRISATLDGGTASVIVSCSIPQLTLAPMPRLELVGVASQLQALIGYADGTVRDITTTAVWRSDVQSVATISPSGIMICKSVGATTISASSDKLTASAAVNCSVPQMMIEGLPALNFIGKTTQLHAVLTYVDGSKSDVTTDADWKTSTPSVATVDPTGIMACQAPGAVSIASSLGTLSAGANLICSTPVLSQVRFASLPKIIRSETPFQFQLLADYTDGTSRDVTSSAVWGADSGTADISQVGLVRCNHPGDANLSASFSGMHANGGFTCVLHSMTGRAGFSEYAKTFDGPFPSWTNVQKAFGAKGDGVTDDTAALQHALDSISQAHPVIWFPRGTYVISAPLTITARQNFSILGEDPDNTALLWKGNTGATLMLMNGSTAFDIGRLKFDGAGIAGTLIDITWDEKAGYYPTHDLVHDCLLTHSPLGIHNGFAGETTVNRVHFDHITQAGLSLDNWNALNINVLDSLFTDNAIGVTNIYGSGAFNVSNSVFVRSTIADLATGNTGPFSFRNNLSVDSHQFLVTGMTGAPANYVIQGNTIYNPGATPIATGTPGSFMLLDNKFLHLDPGFNLVNSYVYGSLRFISAGNSYSVPTPFAGNIGRHTIIDEAPLSADENLSDPVPDHTYVPPPSLSQVFEVPASSSDTAIQQIINTASSAGTSVVHFPASNFAIAHTLVIPSSLGLALIGDGYYSNFVSSATLRGPALKLQSQSTAIENVRFSSYSPSDTDASIEVEIPDLPTSRVICEDCTLNNARASGFEVNGMDWAKLEFRVATFTTAAQGMTIHGGPSRQLGLVSSGGVAAFMTSSSNYSLDLAGQLLIEDGFHDAGQGPYQFVLSGTGRVTQQGGTIDSFTHPAMNLKGFDGELDLLGLETNSYLNIDAASKANILFGGTIESGGRPEYLNLSPSANVQSVSNTTVGATVTDLPDSQVTPVDLESKMALSRTTVLSPRLTALPESKTDVFSRLYIENSAVGVRVTNPGLLVSNRLLSLRPATSVVIALAGCQQNEISLQKEFSLEDGGDGYYGLLFGNSYLSEKMNTADGGSSAVVVPSMLSAAERWAFRQVGDGSVEVLNRATGDSLTLGESGCAAPQKTSNATSQHWLLIRSQVSQ